MNTRPVLELPRPLGITRAGCDEVKFRGYPSIDWTNFMSSYQWQFANALNLNFPFMFFDMKYGRIIFRRHDVGYTFPAWNLRGYGLPNFGAPDYGWEFFGYIPEVLPPGELTFSPGGIRINIDGTLYERLFAEVVAYDDVGVAEYADVEVEVAEKTFFCSKDGYLFRRTPVADRHTNWETAWDGQENTPPVVFADIAIVHRIEFVWWFVDGGVNPDTWNAMKAHAYLSFDTSSLSGAALSSATLRIYATVAAVSTEEEVSDLVVYELIWGTLDAGDWNNGAVAGTLLNADISGAGYYDIDIDVSTIKTSGDTEFMLAINSDIDAYLPSDPADYNPGWGESTGGIGGHQIWCHSRLMANPPRLTVVPS